ncbi:MAG: indolepyruvate oxidoreductase subunit beta [Chloroflexi bacterium]|nr:indolepyruvate oxidoreductase subunit beta [Chloroflexota bacterium]
MSKGKECSIVIAGVGGQGVVLLSELLGVAAVADGLKVHGSEVLGMAVRGGSVSSIVRIGDSISAPLVTTGMCDVLVSMEPSEALRYVSCLSSPSLAIISMEVVTPFMVTLGKCSYPSPEQIVEKLVGAAGKVVALDAVALARRAGSHLAANIVMLGALLATDAVPVKITTVRAEIERHFSAKLVPVNLKAFDLGYQEASAKMG